MRKVLHSKQNLMVLTLIRTLICTLFRNTFNTYTNPKRSVKWTLSVLFRPYVFKLISVQSVQSKCWKCSFKCVQNVQDKCCKRSFKSRVYVWISVDLNQISSKSWMFHQNFQRTRNQSHYSNLWTSEENNLHNNSKITIICPTISLSENE